MTGPLRIGVDGGGSKTECILVDANGTVVAQHVAPGSNPSVVGLEQAKLVVTDALCALLEDADHDGPGEMIESTLLCMAGSRSFWREFAAELADFGRVTAVDDSLPVLELATRGKPGLVLHAGTGSFVAARAPDGSLHYAGGLGWRFGDPGSGYDIGRRAITRALLELQGWAPPSRLGPTLRDYAQLPADADSAALTRHFYHHPEPNRLVAGFAPAVLNLASEADLTAQALVIESAGELVALAAGLAVKLFPAVPLDAVPAGLSGPILTLPIVVQALIPRTPLPLTPVHGTPIEGVRQLMARRFVRD
ncbi:MAG TPA: BadF/BadG/BcrA/BcrD ATPase family protein [Opitutaceae bacterium]|nr:BadF/BadG/BcrA/BcrD ATPase family protein [Opitutaceae bacterium]